MTDTPVLLAAPQGTRLVTWDGSACGTLVARNKGFHRPSSLTPVFTTPISLTRTPDSRRCRSIHTIVCSNSWTVQLAANPRTGPGTNDVVKACLDHMADSSWSLKGKYQVSDSIASFEDVR